ncbi:MAG: hypothetical protein AB1644_01105 [Candidatus Zixiibacteriota bacterium]
MKKTAWIVAIACLLFGLNVAAYDAVGTAFGALTTAQSLGQGKANIGAGVGIADATSVFGQLSYGLSKYTDGRLKLGLVDDYNTELAFGADFKWQFLSTTGDSRRPMDMALGGFFEFTEFGGQTLFQFGGQFFGSRSFRMSNGSALTPYGRFNARLESIEDADTKIRFGLNGGCAWAVSTTINLYGEFQLDGNDGVFFGIDFNMM